MSERLNAFGQPFTGSKIRGPKKRASTPAWPGAQQQEQIPFRPDPKTPAWPGAEPEQDQSELTAGVGNMFGLGDPSKGSENLFGPEPLPGPGSFSSQPPNPLGFDQQPLPGPGSTSFSQQPSDPLGGPAPLPGPGNFDEQPPDPLTGVKPLPKFGGFRANGGPVSPNRRYVVGERGPEMFIPQQPGRIVPMNQRQQPAYDPMAQMMQILQFALQQNQQSQQQQNQDRSFGLEQQQLEMQGQRYDQQFAAQQAAQEQQQQQAVMSALSRAMPQNEMGFDDPTALYQYLQQMGVQVPGMAQQQPTVDPEKERARALLMQLGQ